MNYLHIIPTDIYTQIYKYIYDDCMKDIVFSHNDKRNRKYYNKMIRKIMNDDIWIHYASLDIFNLTSLGIIGNGSGDSNGGNDYGDSDYLDEEMYYLTKITENNFRRYHYNILITELPEIFKEATCIRMTLSLYDIPLYYLLKDFLTTWIELIYFTDKLAKEYLVLNNLEMDMIPLYRFDTVIENGYTVIVPSFE
jgi:hypothetical protein